MTNFTFPKMPNPGVLGVAPNGVTYALTVISITEEIGGAPIIRVEIPGPADISPVAMLLWCPECGDRHIDVGEFATRVHHTHACQSCGMTWRPAVQPTVGVQWLPGFKDK